MSSQKNDIIALYLNSRSIRKKFESIQLIIQNYKPSFIFMTETWIYKNEIEFYNFPNYNAVYSCRNSKGGGCAIFLLETFEYTILEDSVFDGNHFLMLNLTKQNLKLGVFYRKPNSDYQNFINFLDEKLFSSNKLILLGDANINLLNSDNKTGKYTDTVYSNGFNILNKIDKNSATRFDKRYRTPSIIDHVITDISNLNYEIDLSDWPDFDHKIMTLNLKKLLFMSHNNIQKYKKTFIDYDKLERNLKTKLNSINTTEINFEVLHQILQVTIDECKTIKTKKYCNNINTGWFTKELADKIKERNRWYKLHGKYPNNLYIAKKFKESQKETKKMTYDNKKEHFSRKIVESEGNNRKTFKILNNILQRRTKKHNRIDKILNSTGEEITDLQDISNELNKHFTEIAKHISKPKKYSKVHDKNINVNFYLAKTSAEEISSVINDLKRSVSPGHDGISCDILKFLNKTISPYLSAVINKILDEGIFPQCLKWARITPVFKSGDKTDCNNYRPISVLNILSKIVEKIIYTRLMKFLEENEILNAHQYGFLKSKNTLSAITYLTELVNSGIDKKFYNRILFLDFKKAFDMVHHEILLMKLKNLGIEGKSFKLFQSYLTDRYQITKIDKYESDPHKIEYGVPQGSVLGPILFLIYVNDLGEMNLEGKLIMYADDVALVFSGEKNSTLLKMRNDIKKVTEWCAKNNMYLNERKCVYMNFNEKNREIENVEINNCYIKKVDNYKYLGVEIDNKLTFCNQIEKIKNKIRSFCGILSHTSKYLNTNSKYLLYNSFISSHLIYCAVIYNNSLKTDLDKLQRMQNKVLKILFNKSRLTRTETLYKELKILQIEYIIKNESIKLIYKIENKIINNNIRLVENNSFHSYSTRSANHFHVEQAMSNRGLNRVTNSAVKEFNKIPNELKLIANFCNFKKKLKLYLLDKQNI